MGKIKQLLNDKEEEEIMMEEFSVYRAVSDFADCVERYSLEEMLVELAYVLHQRNTVHGG